MATCTPTHTHLLPTLLMRLYLHQHTPMASLGIEYDSEYESIGSASRESLCSATAQAPTFERYPRFMLPRASGLSTMGEIHSLGSSSRTAPLHTDSAASLSGYDQASVYPATWHEYEDQFNYFYNCHFIEQDYYDYLAAGPRRSGDSFVLDDNAGGDGDDEHVDYYSDDNANIDVANIDEHMSDVVVAPSAESTATTEPTEPANAVDPDTA
ncbi:hypothetical protein GGI04_001416 [Coemansia thaxteri]|nr:hypothetical protein GGI04_001416 [Coemansia thaxteri]KAJ2472829.1 hypothetical protein GGI02_001309 [Coemansia sp. RSA 2322]